MPQLRDQIEGERLGNPGRVAVANDARFQTALRMIEPALPWFVAAWLTGVSILSLRLLVGWRTVHRLRSVAVTPAAEAWQARMRDLAARLRVTRTVRLVESALVDVPTVIGWLRPMILVPASALTGLTPRELEAILAHELAHVRRHDYLVNLMQTVIETLLFYHPAVWWLSGRIREEREHCCDDLAVEACGSRLAFAQALTTMEELRSRDIRHRPAALALAADGGSLLARIRRLALGSAADARRSNWWGASLISLAFVAVLGVAAYIAAAAAADQPNQPNAETAIESKLDPEWGPVVNGLRMRVVPVLATMDENAIDVTQRVSKFESPNDVALAVEIENVSDEPVKLAGTRYGDNFGNAKGKSNSDRFGQYLFAIDYLSANDEPIERPEVSSVGGPRAVDGVLLETVEPKQKLRVLLRPARWMSVLSQRPLLGKQRAVARYLGISPSGKEPAPQHPVDEIVAPAVEFEVRGPGYRSTQAPLPGLGEEDVARNADGTDVDPGKFLVWGEVTNGLRAALEIVPEEGRQMLSHGTKPMLKLHVQNVGEQTVSLASLTRLPELLTTVTNDKSEAIPFQGHLSTGVTPAVRIVLKPRQTVTFDAGSLGLAVTKARAEAFERPTMRTLVAPSGKYSLQAVERFGLSFQMRDGNGQLFAPLERDWKGELKTGVATVNISNEIIDCEIVDAVTGQLISDTTTSFGFIKPKSENAPEERVGLMAWGPKGPGRIYFSIPDQIMQRPDREELEVQWGTGNHPDYENYAPAERIPLKQFFTVGPKAAREALSKIKLTPKAQAAKPVAAVDAKAEVNPKGEAEPLPKGEAAQTLFKTWKRGARINGNIPGGALGPLVRVMTNFVKHNPTHEAAPKFTELLKRIDVTHDWTVKEAAALLDEVTAIYASLPEWVEEEDRFTIGREVQAGRPLPADLENAPWGEAKPNGLRTAWLLEPRAEQYAIGARLRSRILIHNSGKETIFFVANSFNQAGGEARDAKGAEVKMSATYWTTIGQLIVFRLAPGQYCELTAPGICVGTMNNDDEEWSDVRIGAWIEAQAGHEVTFTPEPVSVNGTRGGGEGDPKMWLGFIKERLSLDTPLPADAAERKPILARVTLDLFGTVPTAEELAAFTADGATALDALAERLAQRTGTTPFTGSLQGGATKFRVVANDAEAASKPRVCVGPGNRTLGGNARLVIVQKPVGDRRVNEAHIKFSQPDPEAARPPEAYAIKLPDGHLTWAIAWERGSKVLWVAEKGRVRSYRFGVPHKVLEARFEPGSIIDVPEQFYPIGWQSDKSTLWLTQKGILHTYDFSFPGQRRDSRYEAGARIQIPEEFRPGQAPKPDESKKEGAEAKRVLPQRTHFFNKQHSAVGVMTGNEVKFVIAYAGFLSSGMQSWERGDPAAGWGFDGFLYLIDQEKTRTAGKNVDKRRFTVKFTSDAPDTLFLDGKPYDLTQPGRVFVLFDTGEPQRSERTLPLQDQGDLVAIGKLIEVERDQRFSLSHATQEFNQENNRLGIGLDQPPLTEDEVVAAIKQSKWEIKSNRLNEKEIAAFKTVTETRLLPEGSYFQAWTNDQHETLLVKNYWLVELYVPAMGHDGFVGFVIRHTKLADEKIDPKFIAWGRPDADGLSLGICLTPRKTQYQVGERVRLRLFVRNDSQKFVETTWANTTHPMPDDFSVTDEAGAKVAVHIAHDQWRHPWLSGYIEGGIAAGDIHAFNVPYEISIGGGKSAEANKLIGRIIEARAGQTLNLKVRSAIGSERTPGANELAPESGSVAFQVAPRSGTPANDNAGVQSVPPRLEFRIVAQPADGKAGPRAPADYQTRDYPGNSVIGRMVAKDKGFIWVEAVGFTDEPLPEQPVERLRGGKIREVLLADTPEHVLSFNGKWSIVDCRVVPDENGGDRFRIEVKLNAAGGEALRKLTKSHPGQPLAIVVENRVLTAPVINSEIGRDIAITGRFTREQAEKIAAVLRPR